MKTISAIKKINILSDKTMPLYQEYDQPYQTTIYGSLII